MKKQSLLTIATLLFVVTLFWTLGADWLTAVAGSIQATVRLSISSDGTEANASSEGYPAPSDDGQYVAFASSANNLVPEDTNQSLDVFIRDQVNLETWRVSINSQGQEGNSTSRGPDISATGQEIVFYSYANNLVPTDTNDSPDVFLHNFDTGQTELISISSDEVQAVGYSEHPSISDYGRYVAFHSGARLVVTDTNDAFDIYVRDRVAGETHIVSSAPDGSPGNGFYTIHPAISGDGRYIAFMSYSNNLVPNDSNNAMDVFVYDQQTEQTSLVSISSDGAQGNKDSGQPAISVDGRYVVFGSKATNLVPNDNTDFCEGWFYEPCYDIFVHDRETGETTRVSISSAGEEANWWSERPDISADGRFVVFTSSADNLVPDDRNTNCGWTGTNCPDIFVHDRQTGETRRASVSSSAEESSSASDYPTISGDGRFITFISHGSNLVFGDLNGSPDVFAHDRTVFPAATPTHTPTHTPTLTPTQTLTPSPTQTPSPSPSATHTATRTVTPTATATSSSTRTATVQAPETATPSSTPTSTITATVTATEKPPSYPVYLPLIQRSH